MKKLSDTIKIKVLNAEARFTDFNQLHPIPTNTIIDKKLPGFGATHSEFMSHRHSILILPNVASIISKADYYNSKEARSKFDLPQNYRVIAIHEKVKPKDLKEYLNSNNFYNKIITTPEGFIKKVQPLLGDSLNKNYFLLIDESHKITLDAGYRHEIVRPMEHFFKCENKAMVSATTIELTDPRFEEQNFKYINVEPLFDYKKKLNVIQTKTMLFTLYLYIQEHPSENYCIFINSIESIKFLISALQIEEYRIFCSKESKELLKTTHTNVSSTFDYCTTYNFFTSSFYNGLDIIIRDKPKPEVIIISDMYAAHYTAVDPLTDVPQIVGRFRDNYFNSLTHIVTTKKSLLYLTKMEAQQRIDDSSKIYNELSTITLSSMNDHVINILNDALKRLKPYSYLINQDETINHFKLDNYFYEEKIKSYYTSIDRLTATYDLSDHFEISYSYSDVPYFNFSRDDEERGKYSKINYLEVTDALFQLEEHLGTAFYDYAVNELEKTFKHIVTAYNNLGLKALLKHDFNHKKIMQEVIREHAERGWNKQPLIDAVHTHFTIGKKYMLSEIKDALQYLCEFHSITGNITAENIKRFFHVVTTKKDGQRAYMLLEKVQHGVYNRK